MAEKIIIYEINYGTEAVNKRPTTRAVNSFYFGASSSYLRTPMWTAVAPADGDGNARNYFSTWNFYWLSERDVFSFHFFFFSFWGFSLENAKLLLANELRYRMRNACYCQRWKEQTNSVECAYFLLVAHFYANGRQKIFWMRTRARSQGDGLAAEI